jgi:hypothetical protein
MRSVSGRSGERAGHRYLAIAAAVALCGAAVIGGCAGTSDSAVVKIAGTSIARSEVDHWAHAIALGEPGVSLGRLHGSPREKALEFLIGANWLIGEAAEQGHEVSARSVDGVLAEKIAATPNGRGEFQERLSWRGQAIGDAKLEIKATLAAAVVREAVMKRFPALTHDDVAHYYSAHLSSFHAPEERIVDLIEDLPSARAARALGRRLGAGKRFARRAMRESVPRQSAYEAAHRPNGKLVHAIFAATPGKLADPVLFNERWVLLVVRHIVPGAVRPLDQVAEGIATHLLAQRRSAVEPSFLSAYRARWRKRTRCATGFIVQQCAEFRGPRLSEEDPLRRSESGA